MEYNYRKRVRTLKRNQSMGNQQASRTFTKKDVEILVKLSGKSENEIRQWYEEFHIESDETDRMNKRQFQIFYTKLKKNPKLEQITYHIFRAFDTDHSGKNLSIILSFSISFYRHYRHDRFQ